MKDKKYLKDNYDDFNKFLSTVASRELEYLILDSKFTSWFNNRIKKIVEEIKNQGKKDIELSIIFNTNDEIAIIDASILGDFISNNYNICIKRHYKVLDLKNVINKISCKNEKVEMDFTVISLSIIYNTIDMMYKEIICNKSILDKYKKEYNLYLEDSNKSAIIVAVLIILEDICEYLYIDKKIIKDALEYVMCNKII